MLKLGFQTLKALALALLISTWLLNNALQGYIAFACDHGHVHMTSAQHDHEQSSCHEHHHHAHKHDHADDIELGDMQDYLNGIQSTIHVTTAQNSYLDWQSSLQAAYSPAQQLAISARAPPCPHQHLAQIKNTILLI